VPHPTLKVIRAKSITTCNLPACSQKFKLGDPICCIGTNSWFHLGCAVIFTIDTVLANDLVFLRTQVDKFARDKDMAALFHQRLVTRDPIIYCGVPGSGKSTSLTLFVKLTGSSVNEVFVYNSSIAMYGAPPPSSTRIHPCPPSPPTLPSSTSLASLSCRPHLLSRGRALRSAGVGSAKTFHSGALKGLRGTTNALQLKDDRMDCDSAELLDENGTEFDVCHAKVNALINSRFPPPVLRALKFKEVRLPSSPTATAPSLPRRHAPLACAQSRMALYSLETALFATAVDSTYVLALQNCMGLPRCAAMPLTLVALHLIDCASAISQISVDR